MEHQSCLNDLTVPVVADTSVVINLHATQYSEAILDALPNRFLVVSEVRLELEEDRQTGRNDSVTLAALVASGRAEIVQLGDGGIQHFSSLVSGPAAQTLDDGEAATLAYALEMEHGMIPLIDERKANRICVERFMVLPMATMPERSGNVTPQVPGDELIVLGQGFDLGVPGRGCGAKAVRQQHGRPEPCVS